MRFITGLICLVLSLLSSGFGLESPPKCVLFLYHHKPLDTDLLHAYDWIVLDGENPYIKDINNMFYIKNRAKLIGYISVGEIEKYRSYFAELKKFAIGKNPMWDSLIADVRKKDYRSFLIDVVAKDIAKKGFDGFFLDTLDSYKLVAKHDEFAEFKRALVDFVRSLKRKYPDKIIVLNRGFELLDKVHSSIDGVVIESLFYGLDEKRNYVPVGTSKRRELIKYARMVQSYGLPVIIIDYVDPANSKRAISTVKRIQELGFIPYVADRELSQPGWSPCTPIPRKIVLLYDSSITPKRQEADIHRVVQMPLEYLGYIPILYDINEELPDVSPQAGYVGVVSMDISNRSEKLDRWLVRAKRLGLKLFFLQDLPFFDDSVAERFFGLRFKENKDKAGKFKVIYAREGSGFEFPLVVSSVSRLIEPSEGIPVVVAENSLGQRHVPFALTQWGGYAVDNSLFTDSELWVYDPFEVFRKVFRKEDFPVPDTTTENGLRILTAHIDGDGFFGDAEFNPEKTTGEVIRDEILKRFPIPHTVSIIEGEVAPYGLYPQKSKRLENIARSIFALPNVEMASHSFSHPFTWQIKYTPRQDLEYGYNLPIPGYKIDFKREIEGSVRYINSLNIKKKVKVFLWSGSCDPDKEQLKLTYRLKIFNVNGGDTTITKARPYLINVSPMGVNYGPYFQVYAPVQNENVYTNLWTGPYWGYINVIQTFELTERPRRLKPVSIYYHFYSGQKLSSLNVLKKVYKTVLKWNLNPMFLSEFAARVLDFRDTVILKAKGGFLIKNSGYLRTLRIEKSMGKPDLEKSRGVVGFKGEKYYIYVYLDGSGESLLVLSQKPKRWFNLIEANGKVVEYKRNGNTIKVKLSSYLPLKVRFDTGICEVIIGKNRFRSGIYSLQGSNELEIKALCPN